MSAPSLQRCKPSKFGEELVLSNQCCCLCAGAQYLRPYTHVSCVFLLFDMVHAKSCCCEVARMHKGHPRMQHMGEPGNIYLLFIQQPASKSGIITVKHGKASCTNAVTAGTLHALALCHMRAPSQAGQALCACHFHGCILKMNRPLILQWL